MYTVWKKYIFLIEDKLLKHLYLYLLFTCQWCYKFLLILLGFFLCQI